MRAMKVCLIVAITFMISAAADADEPSTRPDPDLLRKTLMPAIDVANQPFDKVLEQIKAKVPGFNFVIYRDVRVPTAYPRLQAMTFENVTIGQFFELVSDQYPVSIKPIFDAYGVNPPLIEVTIKSPAIEPATKDSRIVRVFGLSDIIAYRASKKKGSGEHQEQVTNDVLSLIQAALDEVDATTKPDMKIHRPTEALICKVTEEQGKVIEQVLASLRPTEVQMRQMEDDRHAKLLQLSREEEKVESLGDEIRAFSGLGLAPTPQIVELQHRLQDAQQQLAVGRAAATQP